MATIQSLRERAKSLTWFHAIDFGSFQSVGRHGIDKPANASLYGVMDILKDVDVAGMRCIDIGAVDGLVSAYLELSGASRVIATDLVASPRDTFSLVKEFYGLTAELLPSCPIQGLSKRLGHEKFDVMICAGVFYHMYNPMDIFLEARKVLRKGGLLIVQSVYLPSEERAIMAFNPAETITANLNSYWIPSISAIKAMLATCGFQPVASRAIPNGPKFAAIAGINTDLGSLTEVPEMISEMHRNGNRGSELLAILADCNEAFVSSPREDSIIDVNKYNANFFRPHPVSFTDPVGKTFHKLIQKKAK